MASSKVFSFTTNIDQLAKALNTKVEEIRADVEAGAESLAIQTHAHLLQLATSELKGYNLETYLGKGGENLTWKKVSDRLWVVALDPKAAYIEEGREPVSMATDQWLLKNAKKAKDGSSYKVIPMPQGGSNKGLAGTNAALNSMAKKVIRDAKINMKTIERHENGSPKIGIVKKLNPAAPFTQAQAPSLFSKPRSAADAAKSGLKPHEGIFKLAGLAVTQKEGKNGKVSKEAVTFRVVSSKHRAEGRWMAPRVPAANFFQRTTDWINNEAWPAILKSIAAKHS